MLKDTDKRDNTQVMFKWAEKQDRQKRRSKRRRPVKNNQGPHPGAEDDYPILMVDQLWLWVLEDKQTVVTCFPNTWESNSTYNLVKHCLENHITNRDNRQVITSAMDLANEIIRCGVDFMRRSGPKEMSLQECFQSSISAIVSVRHIWPCHLAVLRRQMLTKLRPRAKRNSLNTLKTLLIS